MNQALFIRRVFIQTCLGGIVFVTSACAAVAPITEIPQPTPDTCVSPALNPYHAHLPPNQVSKIFADYKNGLISYDIARQEAFAKLGENVKQWSDYEDVPIDEQRKLRISVTYLDPMLVQYVILNYALTPPNNFMAPQWFNEQIQKSMERLEKLNETLFMITITSPSYTDPLQVDIPIDDLRLMNASDMKVRPTHHDALLSKPIDITRESMRGIVGYPVSISLQGNCTGIIDQWTNELTLGFELPPQTESLYAGLSWNISYQSPVMVLPQDNGYPVPTMDSSYDINRFIIATAPPTPNWSNTETNDLDSKFYWEEMSRYIWNEVLMEIDH